MVCIVPVRVVGMNAVRVVGGNEPGPVDAASQRLRIRANAFQYRFQEGTVGAAGGCTADFFMVVANQKLGLSWFRVK